MARDSAHAGWPYGVVGANARTEKRIRDGPPNAFSAAPAHDHAQPRPRRGGGDARARVRKAQAPKTSNLPGWVRADIAAPGAHRLHSAFNLHMHVERSRVDPRLRVPAGRGHWDAHIPVDGAGPGDAPDPERLPHALATDLGYYDLDGDGNPDGDIEGWAAPPALAHPDSAPVFTCNGDDSSDASSYQCGFTFFGHTHTFRVDEIVSVVYQDDQQGTPEQWFVPCDPPPAPCMAIDLVPPDTTITAGPPSKVASREAELRFASSEAGSTFECRLDTGGWQECSSPRRYSSMQDGDHVFEARASDAAGNADPTPSHHGWTVDTIGPRVKIAKRTVRVSRRGLVRLRIRCPGSEASGPCRGKLTIKTVRRLRHAKRVSLGGAAFAISAGRTARISVKLSKRNRRLVTRLERVRTRATARASDRLGNVAATSQTFILAAPRD